MKLKNKENESKIKEDKMKIEIEKQNLDILKNNELIQQKEIEINDLKEQLQSTKENFNKQINKYSNDYKTKENELNSEIEKYKTILKENSDELEVKNKKIKLIEENLKKLEEKYAKEKMEFEKQKLDFENCIKKKNEKEEQIKIFEIDKQNRENIVKEKDDIIQNINKENIKLKENIELIKEENNIKLKQSEEKSLDLENKFKYEIKNYEEKLNNKEEQLKKEKEYFSNKLKESKEINEKLKFDIENSQKEILEKQNLNLNNENISSEIKFKDYNSEQKLNNNIKIENQELLQNLLSDILFKLDMSRYYLSLFGLLNKTLENYDKLKYFQNININSIEYPYDHLYHFYLHIKSYFTIGQNNTSLKDLLSKNSFIFSEQSGNNIDDDNLSEKIKSLNILPNIDLNGICEKKKEDYIKKYESIFDSLKQKILSDLSINNKNDIKINKLISITEPKKELEVNFDDLNKSITLAKFHVFNSFNKLK